MFVKKGEKEKKGERLEKQGYYEHFGGIQMISTLLHSWNEDEDACK